MSRTALIAALALVPVLTACEDTEARAYLKQVHDWELNTVYPALRAYCELERHVYDDYHPNVLTPVLRYCPTGGTDPVPPPAPPDTWE